MPFGSEQWMYSTGFYPYEIDQSLRFDFAYLNRTPSVASNRKTWTWSGWVKRSILNTGHLLDVRTGGDIFVFDIGDDNKIISVQFNNYNSQFGLQTTAVFRDPSAWYHIVFVFDTTQAIASNRVKIYVNGIEQSLELRSGYPTTYPALNLDSHINNTYAQAMGAVVGGASNQFDGYLAEVNFIDGQALDATSFGEFKSGVWIPKSYSGTYGTNGFYLPFNDADFVGKDNSTVLGSDLVTNGSFDANVSDWSLNGFCTTSWLSSGKMQINRTGGTGPTAYQAITCEIGATYAIRVQLNSVGSQGDLRVNEAVDSGTILNLSGTNGAVVDVSGQFTATQTTHYLQFYVDNGGTSIIVDDVSVKKITTQGNDWTINNLAVTDQVPDSPTNNFCTMNSLINLDNGRGAGTFAEGNLSFTGEDSTTGSTINPESGKYYWEVYLKEGSGGFLGDLGLSSGYPESFQGLNGAGVRCLTSGTQTFVNGSVVATASTPAALGDVVSFAWDVDNQLLSVYLRNSIIGSALSVPSDALFISFLANGGFGDSSTHIVNFGQDSSFAGNKTAQGNTDANGIGDFYYAPPAGYLALCTANLPDPAIDPAQDDVPEDYFNTVLYTGNGSTQSITGVGFQPDLVWLKSRSNAANHGLHDVLRVIGGNEEILYSNLTNAGNTGGAYISSFDSDGFTVNSNSSGNASGSTYVAWNWKAGGTGVSNTDGTITSTVSANEKAGFSIVSWESTSTITDTVGHGLSQAPEVVIWKDRDGITNWFYITNTVDGSWDYLNLNLTSSKTDYADASTTATTIKNFYTSSGRSVIAYCFHSVEGFSKFGSYTGNGSTDGPFVYTGFRPAFLLIKRASVAGNYWVLTDSARGTYNVMGPELYPNASDAEGTGQSLYDYTSNGFKMRNNFSAFNNSGDTYIYMAFAEMPFKYSSAR